MKTNTILLVLIVALIAGGAGYFVGARGVASTGSRSNFTGAGGFVGRGAGGANGARFRPVAGQIISADAQSVTIKLADGSTKIALLTSSTQITQATKASTSDLQPGTQVAIFGTTNSDGSVTAQSVQLNPQFEMRRGANATPTAQPTQ